MQQEPQRFQNEQQLSQAHAGYYGAQTGKSNLEAQKLSTELGLMRNAENLPDNGVPFALMPKNEQLAASKEIIGQQKFAQGQERVNKIAKDMKDILEKHPGMADEFASALADAGEKPGVIGKLKRKFANKKDLAAYEKFVKLSNDLILQQGESFGKNFTDAKISLLQMAKPNAANTDEANKYLIDKLLYETTPAQKYREALEKGRKGRYMPQIGMKHIETKARKCSNNKCSNYRSSCNQD